MYSMTPDQIDNNKSQIYSAYKQHLGDNVMGLGSIVTHEAARDILHTVFPIRRVREWTDLHPPAKRFTLDELYAFIDYYIAVRNDVEPEVYYANRTTA